MHRISEIEEIVNSESEEFRRIFYRIFSIRTCDGELSLPREIREWAKSRFGECERQRIVRITNKLSHESTLFNELRAKRPLDAKSEVNLEVKDCAFCDAIKRTPADVFGRVVGRHCLTASNIAKYDCMHAVVIFKEHNPLVSDVDVIDDIFNVVETWFEKANVHNPKAVYPFFMWNCLWRAGASIIHGHAQALIAEEPYPKPLQLKKIRNRYFENYGSEYLEDLFYIHNKLGLGFKFEDTSVFVYLTPVKEKEVLMVSKKLKSFAKPLSLALKCYYSLGVMSFNVAAYLPPLGEEDLILLRLVDRGNIETKTADIGGMELYAGASVVSSDPFVLAEKLRNQQLNLPSC